MKILRNGNPQLHYSKDKEQFSTCTNVKSNESHPWINALFQSVEETRYMALTNNMGKMQQCDSHNYI
jgi:hypothetical protein